MRSNGAAIAAIRGRSGISQAELSRRTRIDRTHLVRIEAGERNGTPAQLIEIAVALDVPLAAIIRNEAVA